MTNHRRLIEESTPLHAISEQSAREKSIRHGHISTLRIWWARRPLVTCRAASTPPRIRSSARNSKTSSADIVDWDQVNDGNSAKIQEARRIIAEQRDGETPRVLDPFAGGGAIPLEALRLGCETHALELNPVAHLIDLCTLVYPQKYSQPFDTAQDRPDSREVPAYIRAKDTEEGGQKDVAGDGPWVCPSLH